MFSWTYEKRNPPIALHFTGHDHEGKGEQGGSNQRSKGGYSVRVFMALGI